MCPPDYFGIDYEINPWMHKKNQPDIVLAKKQWENLKNIFKSIGVNVSELTPQKGCPDMVFVANAGLPINGKFILSNFAFKERMPEVKHFEKFFSEKFEIIKLPKDVKFEGQGDAFFAKGKLFLGYGFRSSKKAKDELKKHLKQGQDIVHLKLKNPNFYHLDTALAYIGDDNFLTVKGAFSEEAEKKLKKEGNIIYLSDDDAKNFAANCIVFERNIILNKASKNLKNTLKKLNFNVIESKTSEFIKSGGSVRCLSLVWQ